MARIECKSGCFLRPKNCKKIRDCACKCGELKSINPNLFDGCVDACNSGKAPANVDDYLCNFVGGDALYSYHGLLLCGFTPDQSTELKTVEETMDLIREMNEVQAQADAPAAKVRKAIIAILLILITLGSIYLIFKK